MEASYFVVFGFLVAVVAALELSKNSKDRINTLYSFNAFKNNYLLVYSLMMCNLSQFSFLFSFVILLSVLCLSGDVLGYLQVNYIPNLGAEGEPV